MHRDHFFGLCEHSKSASKAKFRQASNHYKNILEAAKLFYAHKTDESNISDKIGPHNILQIANTVFDGFY